MKNNQKNLNSNIMRFCKKCPFLFMPSLEDQNYIIDSNGVKHRQVSYICLYDLTEIVPSKKCEKISTENKK